MLRFAWILVAQQRPVSSVDSKTRHSVLVEENLIFFAGLVSSLVYVDVGVNVLRRRFMEAMSGLLIERAEQAGGLKHIRNVRPHRARNFGEKTIFELVQMVFRSS